MPGCQYVQLALLATRAQSKLLRKLVFPPLILSIYTRHEVRIDLQIAVARDTRILWSFVCVRV